MIPEFIMFVGIPASGKSTYSQKLKERGYLIVSSDEIREELSKTASENDNLNVLVFDKAHSLVVNALKSGRSVVLDATNLTRKRRRQSFRALYKINCVKKCYLFITSVSECFRRNALRQGYAVVPEDAMQRMLLSFECPGYYEKWDEIVPICDSVPYKFPFEETVGFDQDNPYHHLTLNEHLEKARDFCVEQGFGETIERLAYYHDIGKLYTKTYFNYKGEPCERAHFYGHENYSAYLYLTERCLNGELTKEEFKAVLYETCIINCHMRPLNMWGKFPKSKPRDTEVFGEQFISDLEKLNRADRYAH